MDKANQRSPLNASSLTVATASIVAIMLMLPYFGATTEQGMNAYGQITPHLNSNSKEEDKVKIL